MLENNLNVYRAALISRQPYTIPFIFWRAADLQVWVTKDGVDTLLDPSEYTITGSAVNTGEDIASSDSTISDADLVVADEKVTLTEEAYQTYADYDVITFMRVVDPVQNIDYTNGTNINAEVIERSLDMLTAITQQHEESLKRTLRFSVSEEGSDVNLPDASARANSMLGFGSDGKSAVVRSLTEFDADVEAVAGYAASALESKNIAVSAKDTAVGASETATTKAGEASASATVADNARIASVAETVSTEDEGINTITITYKDGTTKTFTVRNGSKGSTGATGSPAGFGTPSATVDGNTGTPSVTVSSSGPDTAKVFSFAFSNLKGAKGDKGDKGNTPLLSIGEVTYGDTPDVTIDTTDPDNPVLDFVLKTSEVGVVDNLDSSSSVDALSARMGKDIKSQIINLNTSVDTLDVIVGCEAEIENTDPSEGQSILSSSRLIHHVNLLPSGEFGLVGARDVKWNQLVQNGNFASQSVWTIVNGSYSVANNVATITMSDTTGQIQQSLSLISGHTYIFCCDVKASNSTMQLRISNSYGGSDVFSPKDTNWHTLVTRWTGNTTANLAYPNIYANGTTNGDTFQVRNVNLFDLTAMGMDTLTADQFRVLFPASYYPYDAGSIVNLNPTGFSIRGINLWDEEWEQGGISNTTGADITESNAIRNEGYIEVKPSTTYYIYNGSSLNLYFKFFDENKNPIGSSWSASGYNTTITTGATTKYIRWKCSNYGNVYNHDIQIADNSLPSSVKTVYHPFSGQTVPVSISGHYVNENVYDYVTNKTVDGVLRGEVHTKVGVVDLGSLTWSIVTGTLWEATLDAKPVSVSSENAPMLCDTYTPSHEEYLSQRTGEIAITTTGKVRVNNGSTSISPTGNLLYELATEVVTYGEPLRSFSVSDYCTIEPITPQTIANRIDVPFSVLSKSNNGLIEQIAQNTADIADNKQILAQHEARISNLEQVSGEYVQTDLQDYSSVPTGKASFALVETLKGVSRVENQLVKIPSASITTTQNNVTLTDNRDGSYTLNGTASADCTFSYVGAFDALKTTSTYLLAGARTGVTLRVPYGSANDTGSGAIMTVSASVGELRFLVANGTSLNNVTIKPLLTDLTTYFNGGTVPTLAEIQSKYPELLEPRAYNAGEIVDSTYTKVTSRGRNCFTASTLVQRSGYSNLSAVDTENGIRITGRGDEGRFAEFVAEVNVGESYTIRYITGMGLRYAFYDTPPTSAMIYGDGTNMDSNVTVTATKRYLALQIEIPSDGVYQIEAVLGSTLGNYSPYFTATLPIPSVTLKGVGSVHEVYDLETGEVTHPLGEVTINSSNLSDPSDLGDRAIFGVSVTSAIKYTSTSDIPNILMAGFVPVAQSAIWASGTVSASTGNTNVLYVTMPTGTTKADMLSLHGGDVITYELATPDPSTSVTPVIDNTLRTEGGGTVYSDADVGGQFTMGFLNL